MVFRCMISSIFSSWDTCDEVDKKTVHTDLIVREYISLSVKLSVWFQHSAFHSDWALYGIL